MEHSRPYRKFLKKWLIGIGVCLIILLGLITAGFVFIPNGWLAQMKNALTLPLLIGLWSWLESRKLHQTKTDKSLLESAQPFRIKQRIRQIIWGVFVIAGICLSVFSALREWDLVFLFTGLGLTIPSALFYLSELGLGLQTDWLIHHLQQKI
ncbi:MAG: hypothetical protein GYB31_19290 [Bacteroidetes bacterium]|nr:hypothetical protein [Bacteroidota bacterium]